MFSGYLEENNEINWLSGSGTAANGPRITESKLDGVMFSNGAQSDVKLEPSDPKFGGFALVINGHSLVSGLIFDHAQINQYLKLI